MFCLFNRARRRQAHLEDLLKAASLFEKLGRAAEGARLPERRARGAIARAGDDEVCAALARVLGNADEGGGGKTRLDAFDASAALGIRARRRREFLRMG